MRFMVIVKASKDSEAGILPTEAQLAAMGAFNEQMVKAGVLLDGAGLKPSSKGVRLHVDGDRRTVTDGPFAETRELIAGYWIIDVKSMDEAIAWMKRMPEPHADICEIEIRPLYELEDFGEGPAVARQRELGAAIAKRGG